MIMYRPNPSALDSLLRVRTFQTINNSSSINSIMKTAGRVRLVLVNVVRTGLSENRFEESGTHAYQCHRQCQCQKPPVDDETRLGQCPGKFIGLLRKIRGDSPSRHACPFLIQSRSQISHAKAIPMILGVNLISICFVLSYACPVAFVVCQFQ